MDAVINKEPPVTRDFDPDKCNKAYEELVRVLQDNKLTVSELIIAIGNLSYTIGASIEGFQDKGPGLEEVQRLYKEHPEKIGIAFMVQGLMVTTWLNSWQSLNEKENQNV